MDLNDIRDNAGARKARMRVGRGIGSGKGKTAGRGQKGQKARSGVAINGFEGGQMPLHMRLPKRGFNNPSRKNFAEVNLGALQKAVDAGTLTAGTVVDHMVLSQAGLARMSEDGVRVLGKGSLTSALTLRVHGVSAAAREAVEQAGGSVEVVALRKSERADDRSDPRKAKRDARKSAPAS